MTEFKELSEGAKNYFQGLFTATPYCMHEELFDGYHQSVSNEMNKMMEEIPNVDEVKEAIHGLSPDSAPGSDGFTGYFFRGCWEIVKYDIVNMVQGFFLGDHLHRAVKSTMLILIPKVETPAAYCDFRPISLSSFVSKIVTKILANRFSSILSQVIDEEQFGFVKGRQIHESIALAQEMVGDIDRKVEGGNVILKFDMSKAYGRLEWRFLLRALRAMGFSEVIQDMVYRAISDIHYTIAINGECSSEFRSTRGVRQGDPLSPILFIIAQQIFSFNLKTMEAAGKMMPYKLGRNTQSISHLFFADDMLIFSNGRIRSLKHLRVLLRKYEGASGQQINMEKSSLYYLQADYRKKTESSATSAGV